MEYFHTVEAPIWKTDMLHFNDGGSHLIHLAFYYVVMCFLHSSQDFFLDKVLGVLINEKYEGHEYVG